MHSLTEAEKITVQYLQKVEQEHSGEPSKNYSHGIYAKRLFKRMKSNEHTNFSE